MTKKVYKQKYFSKNSNWAILTKNSVTFKRYDGVKDKKLWYFRGSLKIWLWRVTKNQYRVAWTVCRFKEN